MPQPQPPATLHTPRLTIRPCNPHSPTDAATFIRIYNDPFIGKWGFRSVGLNTHEDVLRKYRQHGPANRPELCTRWMEEYGEVREDVLLHMVYLRDQGEGEGQKGSGSDNREGECIGMVGMTFRTEVKWPDFGYALFEQYNGKGYASEAGKRVLEWWREEAGVKDIWVGTFDNNLASQKCARRCGFVEAGEARIVFDDGTQEVIKARGFVLPGMEDQWPKEGMEIRPTVKKT